MTISGTAARRIWLSAAAGVVVLALGLGGRAIRAPSVGIVPVMIAGWIVVAEMRRRRRAPTAAEEGAVADAVAAAVVMGLLFLAFAGADRGLEYLFAWWPADESARALWKSGVVRFALLFATLVPAVGWIPPRWLRIGVVTGAAAALALSFVWLIRATGGETLYRDDHPSFLFRLWAYARSFPSGVFYNPFWNAGTVDTSPLSTGATIVGMSTFPLWRAIDPHESYTWVVGAALLLAVPAMGACSVRMVGGGRLAMAVAALLSAGSGTAACLWALRFGTVPAVLSAAFIMPLCASAARIVGDEHPGWRLAACLAVSLMGFLSWPAAVVMALAPAAAVLAHGGWRAPGRFALLAGGAGLAALALAPVAAGLLLFSGAARLASVPLPVPGFGEGFFEGVRHVGAAIRFGHPVVVFLGLGIVPAWPDRRVRVIVGVTVVGLAAVAGWGEVWKPQFQLSRAQIPMWMAAVLPASLACERLLSLSGATWREARAALLALLVVAGYAMAGRYGNRSPVPYMAMGDEPRELSRWIADAVPSGARVMFAGPTVHGYGGGHIAYLPVLAGRSMMACDYYHFSPATHEYEYPPRAFRAEPDDVFAFLDLYNVAAVLTYHDHWKKFFRRFPDRFEEAAVFGRAEQRVAFRVKRPPPGPFLVGSGRVTEEINRLTVSLDDPKSQAVLRWHWADGMAADAPASVRPFDAGRGVTFIAIDPNGVATVRIGWSPLRGVARRNGDRTP